MHQDLAVEVEARTHSTLSSAVRLRAALGDSICTRLEELTFQLAGLLSRIDRLDFNFVGDQDLLRSLQIDLDKLSGMVQESLERHKNVLPHLEPRDAEDVERFLNILERDHHHLASVLTDFALHFDPKFREALSRAIEKTGPVDQRYLDRQDGLASLSDRD